MFHSTHINETQTDITLIVILTAHLNRFLNRTVLISFINQAIERIFKIICTCKTNQT